MKKFYRLLLVGLLLAPFATLPLDVHAQSVTVSNSIVATSTTPSLGHYESKQRWSDVTRH